VRSSAPSCGKTPDCRSLALWRRDAPYFWRLIQEFTQFDDESSRPLGGGEVSEESEMMRRSSLLLLGALAGAAITVTAIQPPKMFTAAIAKPAPSDSYRQLGLFFAVFERVRAHYVDKPDDTKLLEAAINGMLNGLDPHSGYLDVKSLRDMQVKTRGEFGGLGIEVTMEDGLVKIVAPIDDMPAAKARLRRSGAFCWV
jgi:hypothetical protein